MVIWWHWIIFWRYCCMGNQSGWRFWCKPGLPWSALQYQCVGLCSQLHRGGLPLRDGFLRVREHGSWPDHILCWSAGPGYAWGGNCRWWTLHRLWRSKQWSNSKVPPTVKSKHKKFLTVHTRLRNRRSRSPSHQSNEAMEIVEVTVSSSGSGKQTKGTETIPVILTPSEERNYRNHDNNPWPSTDKRPRRPQGSKTKGKNQKREIPEVEVAHQKKRPQQGRKPGIRNGHQNHAHDRYTEINRYPIIFGNTDVLIRASFYVCQSECMDMRLCTRIIKGQGCRLSRTQTREFLL